MDDGSVFSNIRPFKLSVEKWRSILRDRAPECEEQTMLTGDPHRRSDPIANPFLAGPFRAGVLLGGSPRSPSHDDDLADDDFPEDDLPDEDGDDGSWGGTHSPPRPPVPAQSGDEISLDGDEDHDGGDKRDPLKP